MIDILRNIVAFVATFVLISTIVPVVIGFIPFLFGHKRLSQGSDKIAIWIGIILALVLIPFYSYPC